MSNRQSFTHLLALFLGCQMSWLGLVIDVTTGNLWKPSASIAMHAASQTTMPYFYICNTECYKFSQHPKDTDVLLVLQVIRCNASQKLESPDHKLLDIFNISYHITYHSFLSYHIYDSWLDYLINQIIIISYLNLSTNKKIYNSKNKTTIVHSRWVIVITLCFQQQLRNVGNLNSLLFEKLDYPAFLCQLLSHTSWNTTDIHTIPCWKNRITHIWKLGA